MAEAGIVTIDYTNWRGERAMRRIKPLQLRWDEDNEWHGTGWVLEAICLERQARRDFAMNGVNSWNDERSVAAQQTSN